MIRIISVKKRQLYTTKVERLLKSSDLLLHYALKMIKIYFKEQYTKYLRHSKFSLIKLCKTHYFIKLHPYYFFLLCGFNLS